MVEVLNHERPRSFGQSTKLVHPEFHQAIYWGFVNQLNSSEEQFFETLFDIKLIDVTGDEAANELEVFPVESDFFILACQFVSVKQELDWLTYTE